VPPARQGRFRALVAYRRRSSESSVIASIRILPPDVKSHKIRRGARMPDRRWLWPDDRRPGDQDAHRCDRDWDPEAAKAPKEMTIPWRRACWTTMMFARLEVTIALPAKLLATAMT